MKKLLHSITFHIIGGVICVVLLMIDIALAECLTANAALDEYVMVTGFHIGVSGELYVQTARRGVLCYKNGEYMMTGADGETLTDGAVYGLVYTKG